jgi:pimeloyl-ACP methyl ester carboxylesterase
MIDSIILFLYSSIFYLSASVTSITILFVIVPILLVSSIFIYLSDIIKDSYNKNDNKIETTYQIYQKLKNKSLNKRELKDLLEKEVINEYMNHLSSNNNNNSNETYQIISKWDDIQVDYNFKDKIFINEKWEIHSNFFGWNPDDNFIDDNRKYLLFIHGVASNSLAWLPIIKYLVKDYKIVAIDLPSFGLSPTPDSLKNASSKERHNIISNLLYNFVKHYKLNIGKNGSENKIIVCGHSLGGFLSIAFASQHQNLVDKLILMDPVGILSTQSIYSSYWSVFFKLLPIQNLMKFLAKINIGDFMFEQIFKYMELSIDNYRLYHILSDDKYCYRLCGNYISLNWLNGKSYWNEPMFQKLLELEMPISFIYGEKDTITPPHQGLILSRIMNQNIPVYELINVGHSFITSNPKNVANLLNIAISNAECINIDIDNIDYLKKNITNELMINHSCCFDINLSSKKLNEFYNILKKLSRVDESINKKHVKISIDDDIINDNIINDELNDSNKDNRIDNIDNKNENFEQLEKIINDISL